MTEALRISSVAPARASMNYAALREEGMDLIRALARTSWTDHNVHDPGVTLLEAFGYAMTELGFRIQLDMPHLLQSSAHHTTPDLVPAHRVLPCAPVTPRDWRTVLVDHPLIHDARITVDVKTELPFFEDAVQDPPFSYTPNATPAKLRGLYGAVVEFAEDELNGNTYTIAVIVSTTTYTLDIALPHWDEEEARPFQAGPVVSGVAVLTDGGVAWRPLAESQSYFGEVRVDYLGPGGPASAVLWVVLRITDELPQPILVTSDILNAATASVETTSASSLVDTFVQRVRAAHNAVQQLNRYLASYRNVCEDFVRIEVARVQEITIRARVEVTGSTDLEQLLAEIFVDLDRMLAPPARFVDLAERRAAGANVEEIFDGPLLRNGFLDDAALPANDADTIFLSDVLGLIIRRPSRNGTDRVAQENPSGRDIVAVTDLALSNYVNNRPITVDAEDCLHLVEPDRYRPRISCTKSRVVFVRNNSEVEYDIQRVRNLFAAMREADDAYSSPTAPASLWPVVTGEALPIDDYTPLQNELPRSYGVGEARLPDNVGTERRGAVLQFKGYLLLFEQFLADLTAQLGNINRFFSADAEEQVTYFSRALFELPDVQKLLQQFPSGGDWTGFVANPDNPYTRALRTALESRERFLDRRNRMFDHLLARQGEEMVSFGLELHRYARRELEDVVIAPVDLPVRIEERRGAANARLIRAKAALLRDAPCLNGARLQAFGNPLQHHEGVLLLERAGAGFRWVLTLDGQALLRGVTDHPTRAAAAIAAEEAAVLAGDSSQYAVVSAGGGQQRYRLEDSSGTALRVVGESPTTFASVVLAQSAAVSCAQKFAGFCVAASLMPMEQRILHLAGVRSSERRRLLTSLDAFFEIHDEVDSDGIIEKGWRLWELPGHSGRVMLSSVAYFEDATDAEAVALALESIREVLRYGHDEWNYDVSLAGVGTYTFTLWHPNGNKVGLGPSFPSEAAARQGIDETISHLYHRYSAEGFHTIEHLLLRPRESGDAFLSFPTGPDLALERDPYSQRLSFVFPSGWMRDFSEPADSAARTAAEPHRFRDPECRRHVERIVQQSCPAHVLPNIYWVDRQAPDTPSASDSFDSFEQAYFGWLETLLISGTTPAAAALTRTALIQALNEIALWQSVTNTS